MSGSNNAALLISRPLGSPAVAGILPQTPAPRGMQRAGAAALLHPPTTLVQGTAECQALPGPCADFPSNTHTTLLKPHLWGIRAPTCPGTLFSILTCKVSLSQPWSFPPLPRATRKITNPDLCLEGVWGEATGSPSGCQLRCFAGTALTKGPKLGPSGPGWRSSWPVRLVGASPKMSSGIPECQLFCCGAHGDNGSRGIQTGGLRCSQHAPVFSHAEELSSTTVGVA